MSVENAKKFFDDVDKDEHLRNEVRKNFRNLSAVAQKHGYHFKSSEMLEHLKSRWGATKSPKLGNGDDADTCCSSL